MCLIAVNQAIVLLLIGYWQKLHKPACKLADYYWQWPADLLFDEEITLQICFFVI